MKTKNQKPTRKQLDRLFSELMEYETNNLVSMIIEKMSDEEIINFLKGK